MAVRFGVPPEGEKIRTLVEERLKQAMAEDGAKVTVDWRGEQRHLYVISMPVDMLYFNPDTHRVRAQRTLDPERNHALEERPWSEPAQAYLHDLLRQKPSEPNQTDPDYLALVDELEDFGQREPGIISPDGIIVDGNTRCAALRELGLKDIRVAVLPADTSRRDINSVELALQLRRDRRRDYSYINRLIAIEEELSGGRREEDVARDFNIKVKTLRQDRWVYQMINEAIERSQTNQGTRLRLVDFEQHQEKLRELQRDYAKRAATDPEAAEQLKESRLAMVVLNYPKTSLRLAEADFHSRYLDERLPEELRPVAQESSAIAIPGLPGVSVPDATANVKTARALTDQLLQAEAARLAADKLEPQAIQKADQVIKAARKTFDVAVKLAGQNAQLEKRKIAVQERLSDAADYVKQCAAEFAEAKAKRALDEDAFDDALLELRDSLMRLAKQAGRTFSSPGDGVEWLLAATRED
ncbi:ParB/RepB/Spo0J family partition protein [Nonomuraea sp. NPDC049709]|uniref:ParB/RepB/Spo0J family partition protein n=1 Tax=Nonomuraea sp. NPDC049709 TaxID=3154736 RepID=UPI003449635C